MPSDSPDHDRIPVKPLRWTFGHRLLAAYSTAADGDMRHTGHRRAFLRKTIGLRTCVVPKQIHGVRVADARDTRLGDADGVVTGDPRLAIGVYGADCPGVIVAAPDCMAIGHCGWRGTAGGMVHHLVESLVGKSQHPPSAWCAFIGPGISGPRYEVDAPVLSARAWPEHALAPSVEGRAFLDLTEVLAEDLARAGVFKIQRAGVCTAGDERLHSYRHQGSGIVQMLVTWRT